MKYIKKVFYMILAIIILVTYPLIYGAMLSWELITWIFEKTMFNKYTIRFCSFVHNLYDRIMAVSMFKEIWELHKEISAKNSAEETLEEGFRRMRIDISLLRKKYSCFIKMLWKAFRAEIDTNKKHRLLIMLNQNASIPFYRDIFRFLLDYAEDYRVVPGRLPLDKTGILHVKVKLVGIKEKYLSQVELNDHFCVRLANALSINNELIDIPSDYWDDAIYFPNLSTNLKNSYVVAYIALSTEGKEEIIRIKDEEYSKHSDQLEE